jgi:hypothetical protein
MEPIRSDSKHCSKACPYFVPGAIQNVCDKWLEVLHPSKDDMPMQLPMCAANAAYEKSAEICDFYSYAEYANYVDSCAQEIRKEILK